MSKNKQLFKTVADIDLAHLKRNYSRLYYFGLGFIQLKIDETWRLHFYATELPTITEDVHNHRYDFQSTILAGSLTNSSYQVDEGDQYVMTNVSCNADKPAPDIHRPCNISLHHERTMTAGWSYSMSHNEFHRVSGDDCITLLKRGGYKKEFAQVILPVGKTPVCAFSQKMQKADMWKIIEAMLERHSEVKEVAK